MAVDITFDIGTLTDLLSEYSPREVNKIADAVLESLTIKEDGKIVPIKNPSKEENFDVPCVFSESKEHSVDYSIKADKGKYRPTLCHQITIQAVSCVREHGASIYGGTETWKRVEEQRYKDALYRHWLAYLENPDGIDAESGLPILWHVACNVDFLLEMQRERMEKKENVYE